MDMCRAKVRYSVLSCTLAFVTHILAGHHFEVGCSAQVLTRLQ